MLSPRNSLFDGLNMSRIYDCSIGATWKSKKTKFI